MRYTYDNNYFKDPYQGIPKGGYTRIVKKLLEGVQVCLNTDFFANREELTAQADKVLFTGMIDEFYDYCDKYGIMVWNDFWLYVAYNDVAQPEAFKANALDKVRRLRNHPSIAIWCGANETHPAPDLDN